MPIAARRNSANHNPRIHSDADQESTPHHHHQHAARTHSQAKPPSAGLLSFILRAVIMCVLTSLFFLCVTLATILLIHVFLAGRQLRRRRRRPRHNSNAFSREDLSQLVEFNYCSRDRGDDDDELDNMDPECVICLERFCDGARYRILPGCGHAFHSNCIDAWLVKAAVCPICRASVRINAAEAASSADQSKQLKLL